MRSYFCEAIVMPAKNALKLYSENGYYHVYNRGVAKGEIFLDDQDYKVFLSYLKEYLSPPKPITPKELALMKRPYLCRNYYEKIRLLAFVLMPNHFHLLLSQSQARTIENLTRSLLTRYSVYFNRKYDRVGPLYQGVYKAVLVDRDEYLWWLSRYIHRNPLELMGGHSLVEYPYSSYRYYLDRTSLAWISPDMILANVKDYRGFVEDEDEYKAPKTLPGLYLDF